MNLDVFREKVSQHRRAAGRSQKELAQALGLHPNVLSHKLHGSDGAYLTHPEVKNIIKTLSSWEAISRRKEAVELLEEMGLKGDSFSPDEWNSPPLNRLEYDSQVKRLHAMVQAAITSPPDATTSSVVSNRARITQTMQIAVLRRHNLPAPSTPLLGRDWAVNLVSERLSSDDLRLLTITGTGGVGKTRLALEVGWRFASEDPIPGLSPREMSTSLAEMGAIFPDGVYFVALAGLNDSSLVVSAVAQALDVREGGSRPLIENIKATLENKALLLVIDNFEHVMDAAPIVSELLAASPRLKVLATSREVLKLYGENQFYLPPLDMPGTDRSITPAEATQFAAIQLFVERARAARPDFRLTTDNTQAVAEICARLDGLPLAIELAAARAKLLSPTALLERLNQSEAFKLLDSGLRDRDQRQRTLRAAIDWSYRLLDEREQRLLAYLSVFAGGWELDDATAVCFPLDNYTPEAVVTQAKDEMIELLGALMDKSIVVQVSETRFRLLATVREYAAEKLEAEGNTDAVKLAHATRYQVIARRAARELAGPYEIAWLQRLETDHDNFRAALGWLLTPGALSGKGAGARADTAIRLAAALASFWELQAHWQEGRRWLNAVIERCREADSTNRVEWAAVLLADGQMALRMGLAEEAQKHLETARVLFHARRDQRGEAACLRALGALWGEDPEHFGRATTYFEQSAALYQSLNDEHGLADVMNDWAWTLAYMGDLDAARQIIEENMERCTRLDYARCLALAQSISAMGAWREGNYEAAIERNREALITFYGLGDRWRIITTLAGLALVYAARESQDDALRAARLYGVFHPLQRMVGYVFTAPTQALHDTYVARIIDQIGQAAFDEAQAWGAKRTLAQAVAYALGEWDG